MEAATAVEAAAAMETSARATAMSVSGIWLAERGGAQQSHGSGRKSGYPRPGSMLIGFSHRRLLGISRVFGRL
jgi:hypothetical protein